ncbi:uncharacterized protein RHO25_006503 [Cercospora beticola]|uniref:F-box domain-containing protein n=1 Tax=Cercospora beticola TaxID=122368 RepID=A0ABZ0NQX0_CERBT|nr:hypothetical protein RHO25_006503 [Cercospora beticola]
MPADDGQQEAALALESSRPAAPMAESMPSIAAPRVFGITELLENVLINLPFEDLFVLQRVDKHFNSTIAGSKALRTIMHLELQDISDGHIEQHRCGYVVQDIKLGENATLGDILESFQKRERNGKVQCRKRPGEWHPATSKSNEQMHADEARPAPSLINSAKLVCEWPSLVMVGLLCLAYGVWQRHA